MSPLATRWDSSRSPNAPTRSSVPWDRKVKVTADSASSPPVPGRAFRMAMSTEAVMNPNTVLVNTPASAAAR